jgi:hypothetical protein
MKLFELPYKVEAVLHACIPGFHSVIELLIHVYREMIIADYRFQTMIA